MNEDLQNEIEAINSIYGEESLVATGSEDVYILHLPQQSTSLRIQFPVDYPAASPAVLGTESSGEHTRRGEAAYIVEIFREVLGDLYQPGQVCLFDVIEEVNSRLGNVEEVETGELEQQYLENGDESAATGKSNNSATESEPPWILSDVIVELKSVFIARCAPVSSPHQATKFLQHLLDNDKKVRSATHNITAWRIRGENGVTYQDCDDDGETAAGGRVLHLMQLMDIWNVMVVVTRWYGGHQLGPKRFSIINTVARSAFVAGGFARDDPTAKKKGKH
jgi:putative IMPACT (imprinted ancient) family translation regulator